MRKVKTVVHRIEDLDFNQTEEYIKAHIRVETPPTQDEMKYAISKVGGRISDIESLISRVNAGKNIKGILLQQLLSHPILLFLSS